MKPDWRDAPPWADWLFFQNTERKWYWCENEPKLTGTINPVWNFGGRCEEAFIRDWKNSLERRPKSA